MTAFGSALRAARRAAGLTLEQVAARLGVSVPYLSDVELGNRSPLADERIAEVAAIVGADPRELEVAKAVDRASISVRGLSPEQVREVMTLVAQLQNEGDV